VIINLTKKDEFWRKKTIAYHLKILCNDMTAIIHLAKMSFLALNKKRETNHVFTLERESRTIIERLNY